MFELCLSRWGLDPIRIYETWTEELFVLMVDSMSRNLRREAGEKVEPKIEARVKQIQWEIEEIEQREREDRARIQEEIARVIEQSKRKKQSA